MADDLLFRIPLGEWADKAVEWAKANLRSITDFLSDDVLNPMYDFLQNLLLTPNFASIGIIVVLILLLWRGAKVALFGAGVVMASYVAETWIVSSGAVGFNVFVLAALFVAGAALAYSWRHTALAVFAGIGAYLGFLSETWIAASDGLEVNPYVLGVIYIAIAVGIYFWKGWQAAVAGLAGIALGWATEVLIADATGLGLNAYILGGIYVAIALGVYFWKGQKVALAVFAALALAFVIERWFLVTYELDGEQLQGVDYLPEWTMIALLVFVAYATKGWKLALGSALGFAVIYGVDQWDNAMASFALVLVATIIAIVIGVPLGILAAKNKYVSAVVRPVLDFLQTMPAFVYLIPFVMLLGIGVVPGIVATVLFAIAPAVRFTELGIKQVDKEVVEAAHAFGAHPARILGQIQLPLARATIMGGINQVIMLALSMVVIAGMVGAGGLGRDVYTSVTQVNMELGAESGLAVVILAIFLDRTTAAFGRSKHDEVGK